MQKKTAVQMIHDLKPSIDLVNELIIVLHEASEAVAFNDAAVQLKEGLAQLSIMTATLAAYMKERATEHATELALLRTHKVIRLPTISKIIVLEDDQTLIDSLRYLAKRKNRELIVYKTGDELLSAIKNHSVDTPICLDYNLGVGENGVEVAIKLHALGYKNLYLASGYQIVHSDLPDYLTVLADKKDIVGLMR